MQARPKPIIESVEDRQIGLETELARLQDIFNACNRSQFAPARALTAEVYGQDIATNPDELKTAYATYLAHVSMRGFQGYIDFVSALTKNLHHTDNALNDAIALNDKTSILQIDTLENYAKFLRKHQGFFEERAKACIAGEKTPAFQEKMQAQLDDALDLKEEKKFKTFDERESRFNQLDHQLTLTYLEAGKSNVEHVRYSFGYYASLIDLNHPNAPTRWGRLAAEIARTISYAAYALKISGQKIKDGKTIPRLPTITKTMN
jgi:hypothetical protein